MLQNLQNLQNFAKFQNFQLENLVDFEKCCKTRIFLQKSVPIQPKTSNILPKICQKLATTLRVPGRRGGAGAADEDVRLGLRDQPKPRVVEGELVDLLLADRRVHPGEAMKLSVGKFSAKCCSFSAVSAPIFASKYAFCSIFQNLPDSQAEIFEICQFLQILRHLQICC